MKKWTTLLPVLVVLFGSYGCRHKDTGFAFTSQRQYNHRLFTGGYEFIKFKPDGTVYAEVRQDGINVKTSGKYYCQLRGPVHDIYVSLDEGPRRTIKFSGMLYNMITDDSKSQTWKLHRALKPDENVLM
ncbi:hypothetical protein [Spirosoma pomorum]